MIQQSVRFISDSCVTQSLEAARQWPRRARRPNGAGAAASARRDSRAPPRSGRPPDAVATRTRSAPVHISGADVGYGALGCLQIMPTRQTLRRTLPSSEDDTGPATWAVAATTAACAAAGAAIARAIELRPKSGSDLAT